MVKKKDSKIPLFIILLVLIFMFRGQTFAVVNTAPLSITWKGLEMECSAELKTCSDITDDDFSDGTVSCRWDAGRKTQRATLIAGSTISMEVYTDEAENQGASMRCIINNWDDTNMERIDLLSVGSLIVSTDTRSGSGAGGARLGYGRTINQFSTGRDSLGDVTYINNEVTSRWSATEGAMLTQMDVLDNRFTVFAAAGRGEAEASMDLLDIFITCKQGFNYNNAGACIKTCNTAADLNCDNQVDRAELGTAITGWISWSVTRDDLGEAINAWVNS